MARQTSIDRKIAQALKNPKSVAESYRSVLHNKSLASVHDALEEAGIDWSVSFQPLYFRQFSVMAGPCETGYKEEIPGVQALVARNASSRARTYLGQAGGSYRIIQNEEAFGWLGDLPGKIVAAGTWQGNKPFVVVKCVGATQDLEHHILTVNPHDGQSPLTMRTLFFDRVTGVLYPCPDSMVTRIPHTAKAPALIEFLPKVAGDYVARLNRCVVKTLGEDELGETWFAEFVLGAWGYPKREYIEWKNSDDKTRQPRWLKHLRTTEKIVTQLGGYSYLNGLRAVGLYTEYFSNVKHEKEKPEVGLEARIFGSLAKVKRNARHSVL